MITDTKSTQRSTLKIRSVKTLYHGSDQKFEVFDLDYARSFKDFGKGFYLTTDLKQAQKWAQSKAGLKTETYIYSYGLTKVNKNPELLSEYKILELLQYDKNWIDFISQSRINGQETDYDIIYDRMADNNYRGIADILQKYIQEEITVDMAIEQLRWNKKTADQYCFKTKRAISLLDDQKIYVQYKDKKGIWKYEKPPIENTGGQVN